MVSALIIGSSAMAHHFPFDSPRRPKDADFMVTTDGAEQFTGDVFSHPDLDPWLMMLAKNTVRPASIDELYTVKVSHSYWELNNGTWNKHIHDIRWLKRKGAHLEQDLHDVLYRVWEDVHGKKKTNLSMEKGDFFADAVTRIYDHDSIHDSVAYGDTAMYNLILKNGSTVDVDPKKMWGLGFDGLVSLFREEICATALERIVIPRNYRCSPGAAYRWALRRTITSLTKGKSAQFIVENFDAFAKPDDYVARHLSKKDKLVKL